MHANQKAFKSSLLFLFGDFYFCYNVYLLSPKFFIAMKHPCHKNQIASLRRIKGQIEGVERMIAEGKYCVDILNQIKATKNAISTVEGKVLKTHLQECIKESFNGNGDSDNKIEEIVKLLKR